MIRRAQPASGALDEPVDVSVEVRACVRRALGRPSPQAAPDHNESVCWCGPRHDQPLGISVLLWGARRGRPIANAHGSKSSDEDLTIGPIQITDEVAGTLVRAASLRELIGDPFRGRMRRDAQP
jgi:hypothetical protein